MKNHNLLTKGNVFHVLLAFSVPFLIANVIQALYGAVGSYGHRVILYA